MLIYKSPNNYYFNLLCAMIISILKNVNIKEFKFKFGK